MIEPIEVGELDRTTYIGGSIAAAVLGLGAFGATPLTAYLTLIGEGEQLDPKHQLFLARRKRWEGPIIEMLHEEFDAKIVAVNKRYRDPECDYLAAEIDFEWQDPLDGSIQNGEVKTVSPFAFGERQGWGEAGTGDVPVHYACQAMHGLSVMRRRTCIVVPMIGLDTMLFYRVDRDDEVIADMRARFHTFWFDHVLARRPPDPVNLEDCLKLTARMRGRPVEIDAAIETRLHQLREIRSSKSAMENDEDQIKFEILDYIRRAWNLAPADGMPNTAILTKNRREVASYNLQTTDRIDVKRLREDQPVIAMEYSKRIQSRVLRLKKTV